jgi:hypothetical protein
MKTVYSPGWIARCSSSSMVSMSLSAGAWRTIITDPIRQMAHPIFPRTPSRSSKKYAPSTALAERLVRLLVCVQKSATYPIKTLRAPKGVTRIAGAKAYAAKFAISPITTTTGQSMHHPKVSEIAVLVMIPPHHVGLLKYEKPSPSKPWRSLASFRPYRKTCQRPYPNVSEVFRVR